MEKIKNAISKYSNILYVIAFCLYFLALFIEDLAIIEIETVKKTTYQSIKMCKFLSIAILAGITCINFKKSKNKKILLLEFCAFALLYVASKDFFWLIVFLLGWNFNKKDSHKLFKLSFVFLLVLVVVTIICCSIGVLPNILTTRFWKDTDTRMSLGFYHSNVLPIIIFYLSIFWVMTKKEKNNVQYKIAIICFSIVSIIVYFLCKSRNALIVTLAMNFILLIFDICKFKKIDIRKIKKNITRMLSFSFGFFVLFSIVPVWLCSKKYFMKFWNLMDKIYTNRIYLGSKQLKNIGIHFINFMDSETYKKNPVVLDNAYTYITLRYGFVGVFVFYLIFKSLFKYFKNDIVKITALTFVLIANFTDNDFFSYGFLPFLILGISNFPIYLKVNFKRDKLIYKKIKVKYNKSTNIKE